MLQLTIIFTIGDEFGNGIYSCNRISISSILVQSSLLVIDYNLSSNTYQPSSKLQIYSIFKHQNINLYNYIKSTYDEIKYCENSYDTTVMIHSATIVTKFRISNKKKQFCAQGNSRFRRDYFFSWTFSLYSCNGFNNDILLKVLPPQSIFLLSINYFYFRFHC